ncbi:MAG: beta-lactamase family protein [Bacteroidia bacterium]|nr:beta-lactamase family protein [Bacteroidia bacterium]
MKNTIIITTLLGTLLLIVSGCVQEIPLPKSEITCEGITGDHPKSQSFANLLDTLASEGITGISMFIQSEEEGSWAGASGFAHVEQQLPMEACQLHHSASIYKTFIAVIIMQMVDEGKFSLNDLISKHLDPGILRDIPNSDQIRIIDLLYHRSGLVDVFEVDFLLDFFNNPTHTYSMEELLAYVRGTDAVNVPGMEFYYSDANYILLSLLVNKIEGDYKASIQKRIIEALKLENTFILTDADLAPTGTANSYWDRFGEGKIENVSDIQMALTAGLEGTDGIITNTYDLGIFIQAFQNRNFISKKAYMEMVKFEEVGQIFSERMGISGYGLGLMKIEGKMGSWYGHFGNHVGSAAMVLYQPELELTLVAFINQGTFFSDDMKALFFSRFIFEVEDILQK